MFMVHELMTKGATSLVEIPVPDLWGIKNTTVRKVIYDKLSFPIVRHQSTEI